MAKQIQIKYINLFFDTSWKNLFFRKCFSRPLFFAFKVWGQENVQITKLLEIQDFETLKIKINELVSKVAPLDECHQFSGICFKEENRVLEESGNMFSATEAELHIISPMPSDWFLKKLNLTQKQFLIGEMFLNIDKAWTLLEQSDKQSTDVYKYSVISCITYIRELSYLLAQSYIADKKGEIGRLNRPTKRDACISILQSPKYLFQRINTRNGNSAQDNLQKLKDLYEQIHGVPLQEPNKHGKLTPSDRTIVDWLRAYIPHS